MEVRSWPDLFGFEDGAALCDDRFEVREGGETSVDEGFVERGPEAFSGLEFGRAGWLLSASLTSHRGIAARW